jgi:hypothetical protein
LGNRQQSGASDSGNDTITGGAGADTLTGGDGDDVFLFNDGDVVTGETIAGGNGVNAIRVGECQFFLCLRLSLDLSTAADVACDERPTRWSSRLSIVTQLA